MDNCANWLPARPASACGAASITSSWRTRQVSEPRQPGRRDAVPLFRLDSRHIINFSIAVLSALVVALAVRTGWHSLLNYKQAKTVQLAYAAANDFVAVAADRELERTYGSALLGGIRGAASLRAKVALVRSQGDQAWQLAMCRARLLALYSQGQTELLEPVAQAESSDAALHATRVRLDACADGGECRLDDATWQHVVSKALDDLDAAREAVLLNLDAQGQPIRVYAALYGPAWVVAEYARRQRSIMAFYLSARTPLPQALPMELGAERGVADRAIEELRAYRQLRDVDIRIRVAIDAVDHSLTSSPACRRAIPTALYECSHADSLRWVPGPTPLGQAKYLRRLQRGVPAPRR